MITLRTRRLVLIASNAFLAQAELYDRDLFVSSIGANVTSQWPTESLADVLPMFLDLLTKHPELEGWLSWYAVLSDVGQSTLVGGVGFKGAPDLQGCVEIGYSVVPEYQCRGIACEMVTGLVGWAFADTRVTRIEAETSADNIASQKVLAKCGFVESIPPREGGLRFCRRKTGL